MHTSSKTYDMILAAMFAVVLAVCAWISVPMTVPFTMQTFGLFLTLHLLGGKRGTTAVFIYILLGCAGLPVFSGFTAGPGVLFGTTGGYILGFLFCGLLYWALERGIPGFADRKGLQLFAMTLGMVVYYLFGTLWFMAIYAKTTGSIGLLSVLSWCVFPFVLPDIIKMAMALFLGARLKKVAWISRQ